MHRFAATVLTGLTIVALLATGLIAWNVTRFETDVPFPASADPLAGYEFYAAIDQVLAGGDTDDLRQRLADDFVDHGGTAKGDRSGTQLIAALTRLATTVPGLQLEPIRIDPAGSSLIAIMAPLELSPVAVAGLTLRAEPVSSSQEILRVEDGLIAERWASALPSRSAETFEDVRFPITGGDDKLLLLNRIVLGKSGFYSWHNDDGAIVMVESGAVRLNVSTPSADKSLQSKTLVASASEVAAIPPRSTAILRGAGAQPATLLVFTTRLVLPIGPQAQPPLQFAGDTTSVPLWRSFLPTGDWQLLAGKFALPGNAAETLSMDHDELVMLINDGDALPLLALGGKIEFLETDFTLSQNGGAASVVAGGTALVSGAERIELRTAAASGASIWVVAIAPIRGQATATARFGASKEVSPLCFAIPHVLPSRQTDVGVTRSGDRWTTPLETGRGDG